MLPIVSALSSRLERKILGPCTSVRNLSAALSLSGIDGKMMAAAAGTSAALATALTGLRAGCQVLCRCAGHCPAGLEVGAPGDEFTSLPARHAGAEIAADPQTMMVIFMAWLTA